MAITLATVAAPGATPLANNATAARGFADNYAKLAHGNLSATQQKAISVLGLIYELTAAGGANYKTNHAGLIKDAQVHNGAISMLNKTTADAANEWNAGFVADATLPTSVNSLLADARDFIQLSELQLDRIITLLRAQLRR